jgi:hypothetical protein
MLGKIVDNFIRAFGATSGVIVALHVAGVL